MQDAVVQEGRVIVKQGSVEMVTIANRKITQQQTVMFFMLTDLFLYAKPSIDKKTGMYFCNLCYLFSSLH